MYKRIAVALSIALFSCSVSIWADDMEGANGIEDSVSSCAVSESVVWLGEGSVSESDEDSTVSDNEPNNEMQEEGLEDERINKEVLDESISDNEVEKVEEVISDESVSQNIINEPIEENEDIDVNEEEKMGVSTDSLSVNEEKIDTVSADGISANVKKTDIISENNLSVSENKILKVSMPTKVMAYLDPGNISGKGGVYSDEYKVINYGNCDVAIKIKRINAYYRNGVTEMNESSRESVNEEISSGKEISIKMVWENDHENQEKVLNMTDGQLDEYVLYLKAAKYDEKGNFVKLNKGSEGTFYFSGALNSDSGTEWTEGDIGLKFSYVVTNLEANAQE